MQVGILLALIAATVITGCARRTPGPQVNLVIGQECHPVAHLSNCDTRQEPPKCKVIQLRYDKACERVVVGK